LQLHIAPPKLGVSADWNFGLSLAKTKYVTLAHDDDYYYPDYLSSCLEEADRFDDTLMCFTDYNELVGGKVKSRTLMLFVKRLILRTIMIFRNHLKSVFWRERLLMFGTPISAPSVMFNKHQNDAFNFSRDFNVAFDWEAWTRFARIPGRFVFVRKKLFLHRIHPDSITSTGIKDRERRREDFILFHKYWPAWIAKGLTWLYSFSYKLNKTPSEP
jgi:glycosyltransferase involved in cell wall biosynthesis